MSNYDTILEEQQKKEKKKAEADAEQYAQDAATLKEQYNATIDKSAAAQTGIYQQEIKQAPLDSRALYDQNAMTDAVNRTKIQETLANMGMTDSGISSSMHTALAVQKSRADNQVRADEQQRIRAAEATIDQILAEAETQKATAAMEIDQDVANYKRTRLENADTVATQTATSLYSTQAEQATEATKMALDYQNKRSAAVQAHTADGKTVNEALALAYAAYPDTSTVEGVKYYHYNQLTQQGVGRGYATAASEAYANALANGKTTDGADTDSMNAIKQIAEQEMNEKGHRATVAASTDDIEQLLKRYQGSTRFFGQKEELSPTAQAYAVGKAYSEMVAASPIDDNTVAQSVGSALAQYFSGIYLDVALDAAGLE